MSEAERNELNENEWENKSEGNPTESAEQAEMVEASSAEEANVESLVVDAEEATETADVTETAEVERKQLLTEPMEDFEIVTPVEEERPARYEYRWNYAAQKAFDEGEKKKTRKRGAWTYAIVMASAFLLCFAMLAGVLVWYGVTGRSKQAYGSLSATEVTERIAPSTVLIYTKQKNGGYRSGTGFFIRSDGYIATNYHVVENGTQFEVTLYNAERVNAELIGVSKENDLAILKIKGSRYPTAAIGNSDAVQVGDNVYVIGNPNGAYGAWSTTHGIISSVDRQTTINNKTFRMLQTDAAINPGNSGGPLCNDRGEVIGVVTQIMLDQDGNRSEGFGMAIPINKAMDILEDILKNQNQ